MRDDALWIRFLAHLCNSIIVIKYRIIQQLIKYEMR